MTARLILIALGVEVNGGQKPQSKFTNGEKKGGDYYTAGRRIFEQEGCQKKSSAGKEGKKMIWIGRFKGGVPTCKFYEMGLARVPVPPKKIP